MTFGERVQRTREHRGRRKTNWHSGPAFRSLHSIGSNQGPRLEQASKCSKSSHEPSVSARIICVACTRRLDHNTESDQTKELVS